MLSSLSVGKRFDFKFRMNVITSPKISEKPDPKRVSGTKGRIFRHIRGRFLLPNRKEVQKRDLNANFSVWRRAEVLMVQYRA
jgi:hypothetical protein